MSILLTPKQKIEVRRAATLAAIPPGDCLMSAAQVAARLSLGVRTLWRMTAQGRFPQPIRFTRKLVRWHSTAVKAWLDGLLDRPPEQAASA